MTVAFEQKNKIAVKLKIRRKVTKSPKKVPPCRALPRCNHAMGASRPAALLYVPSTCVLMSTVLYLETRYLPKFESTAQFPCMLMLAGTSLHGPIVTWYDLRHFFLSRSRVLRFTIGKY